MRKGFTIVEVLAVITIISILLLVAVPLYSNIAFSINEKYLQI